jgi:hypothetical protein
MDPSFDLIFSKFSSSFPAGTEDDYTLKLTTAELYKTFTSFYPGEISETELFNKLKDSGYPYFPENRSGSINFYWLLRERK